MKYETKLMLLKYIGNVILLIVQVGLFSCLWFFHYISLLADLGRGFYYWGYWAVIGLYLLFVVFFTKNFDGYKSEFRRGKRTALNHIISVICANGVGVIQIWIIARYYFSVVPIIFLTAVQILFILGWAFLMKKIYMSTNKRQGLLVIYDSYSPNVFLEKDTNIHEMYTVNRILNLNFNEGNNQYIYEEIQKNDVILLYEIPSEIRNNILKYCYSNKKNVLITPKISDILISGGEELSFIDKPLLFIESRGLRVESLFLKRCSDIILALLAIVITSPLILIFAALIKLYDRGKVFYTQERITIDELPFQIIKFRSMVEDSEDEGARLAQQNDSRITPIGRFLRATHLDELPQIFNILRGEMSFVGPRPERREIADEYEKIIPEFKYRTTVKAGLTGYAQVYGKYNTPPYDKLRLDLKYIENYSIGLDFKLILMTLKIMFQRDNTEGVDINQKNAIQNSKVESIKIKEE